MKDPQPFTIRRAHGVAAGPDGMPVVPLEDELNALEEAPAPTPMLKHERELRRKARAREPTPASKWRDRTDPHVVECYDDVLEDLRRKQVEIEIAIKAIEALQK